MIRAVSAIIVNQLFLGMFQKIMIIDITLNEINSVVKRNSSECSCYIDYVRNFMVKLKFKLCINKLLIEELYFRQLELVEGERFSNESESYMSLKSATLSVHSGI